MSNYYRLFTLSRTILSCYIDRSKQTCIRQVGLDKWSPPASCRTMPSLPHASVRLSHHFSAGCSCGQTPICRCFSEQNINTSIVWFEVWYQYMCLPKSENCPAVRLRDWRNTIWNLIETCCCRTKPIAGLNLSVGAWNAAGYGFIEFEISTVFRQPLTDASGRIELARTIPSTWMMNQRNK